MLDSVQRLSALGQGHGASVPASGRNVLGPFCRGIEFEDLDEFNAFGIFVAKEVSQRTLILNQEESPFALSRVYRTALERRQLLPIAKILRLQG